MKVSTLPDPNPDVIRQLDHWSAWKDEKGSGHNLDWDIPHYARKIPRNHSIRTESTLNRSLRIGIFTSWKFPHKGGLSTYIMTLKEELQGRGHQVDIISQNSFGSKWHPFPWALHVQQFYKQRYGAEARDLGGPEYRLCLYEHLVAKRNLGEYDILHAQDVFTANILIRLRERHRRPVVYSPHGIMTDRRINMEGTSPDSLVGLYYRMLDSIAATGCDSAIVLYKNLAAGLSEFGLTEGRTYIVPTGISDSESEKMPTKRVRLPGVSEPTITYIGRMKESKGPQYVLEAVERLNTRGLTMRVLMVGDGPTLQFLRRQSRRCRGVYFMGWQTDSAVKEILRQSDILVIPGTNESFPVVGLEGMFAGTAIIASRCGGIPEMIHAEETGVLIPPGNVDALAEQLYRLIRDDALRARLGKTAQAYAKTHFTAERMAEKVEAVYHHTLDQEQLPIP